jgi:hypothetical protein
VRLLVLLLLALPAVAEDEIGIRFDCGKVTCTIVKADLGMLLKDNTEWFNRMKVAEDKLAKNPPKCATTEITEPSKAPIPPIKPESDT